MLKSMTFSSKIIKWVYINIWHCPFRWHACTIAHLCVLVFKGALTWADIYSAYLYISYSQYHYVCMLLNVKFGSSPHGKGTGGIVIMSVKNTQGQLRSVVWHWRWHSSKTQKSRDHFQRMQNEFLKLLDFLWSSKPKSKTLARYTQNIWLV